MSRPSPGSVEIVKRTKAVQKSTSIDFFFVFFCFVPGLPKENQRYCASNGYGTFTHGSQTLLSRTGTSSTVGPISSVCVYGKTEFEGILV